MASRFTLHGFWLSGPTYKVALMLSMCGEQFAYRHVDLRAAQHKTPEFLALNRYGQVPALVDNDASLCQSGSILQHLAAKLGKFSGNSPPEQARAREWLFWDFDRLSPNIYRTRAIKRGFFKADEAVAALYRAQGEDALKVLDAQLAKTPFLTGSAPSIADIAIYGVVVFAEEGAFDLGKLPHLTAWKERFEKLPGVKHPYDLLPQQDAA
jgi:glutathione S-transferase